MLAIVVALGFGTAYFISKTNTYITRGVLGCAVLYLISREIKFSFGKDEPIETLYSLFRNIKFLLWFFTLSLILFWSISDIFNLFLYVIVNLFVPGK